MTYAHSGGNAVVVVLVLLVVARWLVCWFACLHGCMFAGLSVCLLVAFGCFWLLVCLFVFVSVFVFVCLLVCLLVCCLFACLLCLSAWLFVWLSFLLLLPLLLVVGNMILRSSGKGTCYVRWSTRPLTLTHAAGDLLEHCTLRVRRMDVEFGLRLIRACARVSLSRSAATPTVSTSTLISAESSTYPWVM